MAIPQFPQRAYRAVAYLFRPYNDIDVYVEDTASRNMYEVLVNRLLDGNAMVQRVIQVGNRDQVVAACAADQGPNVRRRIYIVDGDFDLMLRIPSPPLKHFYRLNVYASENLLFSQDAISEVAYECLSNMDRAEIEKLLKIRNFMQEIVSVLAPLFLVYAVARELDKTIRTSGHNVMTMCEHQGKCPRIEKTKVQARAVEVRTAVEASTTEAEIERVQQEVSARLADGTISPEMYISGKTYLLPLVFHYLRANAGFAGTIEQLKVRLARYTDLAIDAGLQPAVLAASRQ